MTGTLYIERPNNAQEQSTLYLHKVMVDDTKAVCEEAIVEHVTGRIVEIFSPFAPMSQWAITDLNSNENYYPQGKLIDYN